MTNMRFIHISICVAVAAILGLGAGTASAGSVKDATALFNQGQVVEATAQLATILEKAPDNLSARFWLGRCKLESGDISGAADDLQAVLTVKPGSTETRYWLGVVRRRQGQVEQARALFEQVLAEAPKHRQARESLDEIEKAVGARAAETSHDWVLATPSNRMSVEVEGLAIKPGDVQLFSDHVYDYTFADPPVDWTLAGGLWELTNRWTCSPQWSWYGGFETNGVAAIWNKRQFEGDITVEVYLGFKMGVALGEGRSYRNPNDMNITICADGANLDSGYSFIYGGDLNSRSRIVRGDETLVESREPEALLPIFEDGFPSTYEFHRKWWALRVRKSGDLLQFYVDEKLICETRDPNPLEGGRVAIWARDNGIIISRIKVYYEHEKTPRDPTPTDHLRTRTVTEVAQRQATLSSDSHRSLSNDFEFDLGGLVGRDKTQGASVSLHAPGAGNVGHCAELTNTNSGGTFGATLYAGSFDVRKLPRLSFDYRAEADAKVNLYLTAGDQLHEIVLSGRSAPASTASILGRIEDAQADNIWRHADFDLLGHLQQAGVAGQGLVARDLFIANLNDDDYLDVGFGGNHAGATIFLDNLRIYGSGGAEVVATAAPARGTKVSGWAVTLSDTPDANLAEEVNSADGKATLTADSDGVWYVCARPQLEDGTWGAVYTMPVTVDTTPPKIVSVEPKGGALTSNAPIEIAVSDGAGVGVDPASIVVKVGEGEWHVGDAGVSFDPAREVVLITPDLLGQVFSKPGGLAVSMVAMADRNGLAMTEPASWTFKVGPGKDHDMPSMPIITVGDTPLLRDDFETKLGEWVNWGGDGGAVVSRDRSTAAHGDWSLKLYNAINGGTFGAYVRKTTFDAGKYRLVRFWYKVPARLRADFIVFVNGAKKSIRFTDTDSSYQRIGEVPDVIADNQWHHTEFNLFEMLRRDDPHAPGYKVHQLLLADGGYTSNAPGQIYHIDDFQLVPISSAADPLRIAWTVNDLSGLGGVNWRVDESADTDLPKKNVTSQAHVDYHEGGMDGWLHVRASDSAGNWGLTAHRRLIIDSDAPTATQVAPAAGASTAVSEVKLDLSDTGDAGVDPGSVILNVGGADYTVSNGGLTYLSELGELAFNCEQTSPRPTVFKDGSEVVVQLKQAADYAGNAVQTLPEWTWTMDYSKDASPPTIARLECRTHAATLVQTFEGGVDGWGNRGGGAGALVEHDTSQAGSGQGSVKLTQQNAGGHMQAVITNQAFQAEDYPVIAFDYRFDKGVKLSLMVNMAGRWHAVSLTDDAKGAIGRISGMRADGKWHYASVHLAPLLRRQQKRGALNVQAIIIGDRDPLNTPKGATANFDNFIVGRVGTSKPVFRWSATDATGITGYSYVLDQEPTTVPPEESKGAKLAMTFSDLKKGLWFLHLRAVDGAGNWGPTTHYGVMHAGN
jgi:hypothetical protein